MRKTLALALIVAASPVLADVDGPGAVTAEKTLGAAAPECHQFKTNGGSFTAKTGTPYGISVNTHGYPGALASIVQSHDGLCKLSFDVVNSIPDCPGITAVAGLVCE